MGRVSASLESRELELEGHEGSRLLLGVDLGRERSAPVTMVDQAVAGRG